MDRNEFAKQFDAQMKEANDEIQREAFKNMHDFYKGLIDAGFDKNEAMQLIVSAINAALKNSSVGRG